MPQCGEHIKMSTHFHPRTIVAGRANEVLDVKRFASDHKLDDKQTRDLLRLFGAFATRHELLTNCVIPRTTR
jgi:hypothetical protein